MVNYFAIFRKKNVSLAGNRMECNECGQEWSPILLKGGRMPNRYWQCPNECNKEETA